MNNSFVDSHIHTHYSHGSSEVFEMSLSAVENGIKNIGFAEHFHYDYLEDYGLPTVAGRAVEGTKMENFKMYYKSVERAQKYFKEKLNIRLGVEIDYIKGEDEKIKKALDAQPFFSDFRELQPERKFEFDFIMGSVHFFGKPLKYFSDYKDRGDDWMVNEYFLQTKSLIESDIFDIIGHPELIKYFVALTEDDYKHYLDEITSLLKKYNTAVDLNTDYIKIADEKSAMENINPGLAMLGMCRDKNIPLVLGSDAHRPEKIANNFSEAKKVLRKINIHKLYYFQRGELISYEI